VARRRRPRIGITGPDRGGWPAWVFASWIVRSLGGRPIRLRPGHPRDVCLDGVIVGGGADVSPELYAERIKPAQESSLEDEYAKMERDLGRAQALLSLVLAPLISLIRRFCGRKRMYIGSDAARDEFELAIMRRAQVHDLPLLGICRGAQLMNVFAGGDLHRDLTEFYVEAPNPWTVLPRKRVRIEDGSILQRLLDRRSCRVNSLHRQAIKRLGADLRVSAWDMAAVAQAVERTDGLFWVGVQWHPEYLPQRPEQRRLIGQIVDRARSAQSAALRREELWS
jgi:putative glutamine amidotransferase